MAKNYTITQLRKDYPTDQAVLDKIWQIKYGELTHCPKCLQETKYRRVQTRTCYQCVKCYHQIHPTKGTIFEKSTTPLTLWIYAMYLFTASKNGLSAKELERQLGVTYKTAWRMLMQIRSLLETDVELLEGVFEIDETYIGGRNKNRHKHKKVPHIIGRGAADKQPVLGILQRDGKVRTQKIEDVKAHTLQPIIRANIKPDSTINTDEWRGYIGLHKDYEHKKVRHNLGQYVDGDVTTNRIENYWSIAKRTIGGCYVTVSRKYLQNYMNEVSYKYNNRGSKTMLNDLMKTI